MSKTLQAVYLALSNAIPELRRGMVWCIKCGKTEIVSPAHCLEHGWPKCCGQTMTTDSPEERGVVRRPVR